jgi:hypothetical protein
MRSLEPDWVLSDDIEVHHTVTFLYKGLSHNKTAAIVPKRPEQTNNSGVNVS